MEKKRLIALLLALCMLFAFALTSCGSKETDSKENKQQNNEETNTSILEPESNLVKAWGYFTEEQVSDFIRNYPEHEFEVETDGVVGVFEVDKTVDLPRLSAAIASKDQPDLVLAMMRPSEAYYSNLFQPVQKYLDVDPAYKMEDFDDGAFEEVVFNDVVYFLPVDYTSAVFVWNRSLIENVGLDPDNPPKTWDELVQMCEKTVTTHANGSIKTIGMDSSYPWRDWHAASFGKDYVDNTGLSFSWDTDEWRKTFEFLKNLPNTYGGKDKLSGDLRFIFGQTAFAGWNGAALRTLYEWSGDVFKIDFGTFPAYDENFEVYVPASQGASYAIPKGAHNPAGGWRLAVYSLTKGKLDDELINYQNNPDNYMPTYIIHQPTRQELYDMFEQLLNEEQFERMKKRDEIESNRNIILYSTPVYSDLMVYFEEEYKKMLDGTVNVPDFVKNLQERSEQLISEFIKNKEAEGWVFEEGKDGIPPVTEQ